MNTLKLSVGENSIIKIGGDCRRTMISCEKGLVSVTQQNDSDDHILSGNNNFCINKKGLVIAWALSAAEIEIVFPDTVGSSLSERLKRLVAGRKT